MGRNKIRAFINTQQMIFAALSPGFVKTQSHIKGTSTNGMKVNLLFLLNNFWIILLFDVSKCVSACMCTTHMLVPAEVRREHWMDSLDLELTDDFKPLCGR